ncbi:ABC transporter permease [Ktedonosporobacter rubrisoli]|uniref:ABC transporter permease n=1 Tax=Ktedonosporobacter rubrisoli TaxID=2509675 RepID=A0A4P6JJ10_KTERU|nr:ABC transporter permease [Ktedonosporobacter rubrisoli]QBD74900.1 ABC transporter permease [Ktedonosporobacter rubrisoli]
MKLTLLYFKAETLGLLRIPMVVVFTLLFPVLFFALFGLPAGGETEIATIEMASFTIYAVLGIAVNQFGVNIAEDRSTSWEKFLHTLPVSPVPRFSARILTALVFAGVAGGLVVICALMFSKARIDSGIVCPFLLYTLLGSIPFCLLGISIGYWFSPKAALPVGNILYFLLAFAGGLWIPPQALPPFIANISPYLPTREYGEIIWNTVLGGTQHIVPWLWLCFYTLLFGGLAVWGYRRDEGQRYR